VFTPSDQLMCSGIISNYATLAFHPYKPLWNTPNQWKDYTIVDTLGLKGLISNMW